MKQIFIGAIIVLAMSCSSESETGPINEPFVGNWSTIHVVNDGAIQPEWSNTSLIIEQESKMGGSYQMLNTPYDSIWAPNGHWTVFDEPNTFLLDDNIVVSYLQEDNSLSLIKELPASGMPCDWEKDSVCITAIAGQWDFRFIKN